MAPRLLDAYRATLAWIEFRKKAVEALKVLAKSLVHDQEKYRKAKVTGKTMALVGGALGVAGTGLAFFTLGTSLLLTIPGAFIGVAGGSAATIADLYESKYKGEALEKMKQCLEKDRALLEGVLVEFRKVAQHTTIPEEKYWTTVLRYFNYGCLAWQGTMPTRLAGCMMYTAATGGAIAAEYGQTAFKTATTFGKTFSIGMAAVGVPFVVYDAVSLISLLNDTEPPELAAALNEAAKMLRPPSEDEINRAFAGLKQELDKHTAGKEA